MTESKTKAVRQNAVLAVASGLDASLLRPIAAAASPAPLFPGGPPALAEGRAHEVCGDAAHAFAAVQAGLRQGPLIWILPPPRSGRMQAAGERPDPYGLARFIDPGRLILVETSAEEDVFWAMEEALRSGAAPCVIAAAPARGPFASADLTRSRRLQLAAETSGALGLLLLGDEINARSNAAETRWRAAPAPSGASSSVARPVWEWRLLKNKRGPLGRWRLRWRGRPQHRLSSHDLNALASRASPQHDTPHPLALVAPSDGGARAAA